MTFQFCLTLVAITCIVDVLLKQIAGHTHGTMSIISHKAIAARKKNILKQALVYTIYRRKFLLPYYATFRQTMGNLIRTTIMIAVEAPGVKRELVLVPVLNVPVDNLGSVLIQT